MRLASSAARVVGALWLLAGVGCARVRYTLDEPAYWDRPMVAGESTHRDVLDQLGPPAKLTALPDGFAFLYEHLTSDEDQLGIGIGEFVGIVIPRFQDLGFQIAFAKGYGYHEILLLEFDRDGRLRDAAFQRRDQDQGFTFGLTHSLTAQRVGGFTIVEPLMANYWGAVLLRPPPMGLNVAQDLDSGASGLQQRNLSPDVGQGVTIPRPDDALVARELGPLQE